MDGEREKKKEEEVGGFGDVVRMGERAGRGDSRREGKDSRARGQGGGSRKKEKEKERSRKGKSARGKKDGERENIDWVTDA